MSSNYDRLVLQYSSEDQEQSTEADDQPVILWSEDQQWSPSWDTQPKVLLQSLEDFRSDTTASHEEEDANIRTSVEGFDVSELHSHNI
jgi:hypothetical protein